MKRRLLTLCLVFALLSGGCARFPVEERSFAVVLGISATSDVWEVSARIPSYQQEGGYLTLSARGASFGEAMALMNATAPMQLHYGQLRMIIFSKELAESSEFAGVLHALAARSDVRMQASLCVTEDNLPDMMDALDPQTGTRLSKSIETLLETRLNLGVVPDTTLSSVQRIGERENPVLICVALENELANTQPGMDAPAGVQAAKGAGTVQFAGGWLVGKNGTVTGQLSALEQQLLTLMAGGLRKGMLALQQGTVTLLDAASSIDLKEGKAVCHVTVRYSEATLSDADVALALTQAMESVVGKLASSGCDALGIGRKVISSCATLADWRALRWPDRYPALEWSISVEAHAAA